MEHDELYSWLTWRPFAHRGLHDVEKGIPENTLAAFEKAVLTGFPLELDVHLLQDGALAVFHDENTLRMTGIDRNVRGLVSSDLKRFRLAGTNETIPLLEEALELVNGKVPVLVELKSTGAAGSLEARASDVLTAYRGRVAVQSFNPLTLRWFKAHMPRVPRGQLGGRMRDTGLPVSSRFLVRTLVCTIYSKPHFIGYEAKALPHIPSGFARTLGVPLLAWTVSSAEEHRRVKRFCDNIIFEGFYPAQDS